MADIHPGKAELHSSLDTETAALDDIKDDAPQFSRQDRIRRELRRRDFLTHEQDQAQFPRLAFRRSGGNQMPVPTTLGKAIK